MSFSEPLGPFARLEDLEGILARRSHTKVQWVCSLGHRWLQAPADIKTEANCVYCSGKKILPGFNDLKTVHPEIAKEWHPNNAVPVDTIAPKSLKPYWWVCKAGHEWENTVASRTRAGAAGCKVCSGKQVLRGYNDLGTTHSEIATQWHPIKNQPLTPADVTAKNDNAVWWLDEYGHEWKNSVRNRTVLGNGCPYCSGRKAIPGGTDLATKHPELMKFWDDSINIVSPTEVTPHSKEVIALKCEGAPVDYFREIIQLHRKMPLLFWR